MKARKGFVNGKFVLSVLVIAVAFHGVASWGESEVNVIRLEEGSKYISEADPVFQFISKMAFAGLQPKYQEMLRRTAEYMDTLSVTDNPPSIPAMCFSPGTPPEVVAALGQFYDTQSLKFRQGPRWTSTATNAGPLGQGDPATLTYSFVPDGTNIPSAPFIGEPAGISDLDFDLAAVYGSTALWQAEFNTVFAQWGALTGVTYVLEVDDGAAMGTGGATGAVGVRGDVRIGGHFIDGAGSGVLAYNFFPGSGAGGDMVMDTDNAVFFGAAQFLRNTVSHEHGHGLGMDHVCPTSGTKMMEPLVPLGLTGPGEDDILNGQRHYGDPNSGNDTFGTATSATASFGAHTLSNVSIDTLTESDWYSLTVAGPTLIDATLKPIGTTYSEGADTGLDLCFTASPTPVNAKTALNLDLEIIDSDGSTVLASSTGAVAGLNESVSSVLLSSAGTYYVRAFASAGGIGIIQRYEVDYVLALGSAMASFSVGTFNGAEDVGTATIRVNLSAAPGGSGGTVDYSTSVPGSGNVATPVTDYTPISSATLSFGAAETSKTFDVIIVNDGTPESIETVTLTLSNPTGGIGAVGGPATLRIFDVITIPVSGIIGLGILAGLCTLGGFMVLRRKRT